MSKGNTQTWIFVYRIKTPIKLKYAYTVFRIVKCFTYKLNRNNNSK